MDNWLSRINISVAINNVLESHSYKSIFIFVCACADTCARVSV